MEELLEWRECLARLERVGARLLFSLVSGSAPLMEEGGRMVGVRCSLGHLRPFIVSMADLMALVNAFCRPWVAS